VAKKIIVAVVTMLLVSGGLLFAAGGSEAPSGEGDYFIGGAIMNLAWPWFLGTQEGMENLAQREGDIELTFADGQFDISTQIQQLENMAQLGVDGIVIFPVDGKAIIPTMVDLADQGIKLVVGDYPQSPEREEDIVWETFVGHDFTAMGEVAGELAVDYLKEENITDPVVAFITIPPSGQATEDRYNGFADTVLEAFPNAEVIKQGDPSGDMDSAQTVFENVLTTTDRIDVVSGHNDAVVLGAYNAAEAQGRESEMKFIGLAGMKEVLEFIENGNEAWLGEVLQDPVVLGETAMEALLLSLEGESLPDRYPLPRPEAITSENIDEYNWKEWEWLGR